MYELKVTKLEKKENSKVIGLASLVVDGQMKFNNIRLIENDSERGFFVAMPSYKKADGEYEYYFHPITREMVDKLADAASKSLESGESVKFYTNYPEEVFHISVRDTVQMRISNDFVCKSIQIRQNGKDGSLFVAMPAYKKKDGTYENVCYPITTDFRNTLSEKILAARTCAIEKSSEEKSYVPEEGLQNIPERENTKAAKKEETEIKTPATEKPKKTQSRKGKSR